MKLKIISDGLAINTRVLAGDVDISRYVSGVKWETDVHGKMGAEVTLTCPVVELEAEGVLVDVMTVGLRVREFDSATCEKAAERDAIVETLRALI